MTRTGKSVHALIGLVVFLLIPFSADAALKASVDRTEVPIDESITFKISSAGDGNEPLSPTFDSPDFEIINQFQSSQFSSVYINGKFENKSENSITYILRPMKVGSLKIRNIANRGERAPDINIQVIQESLYKKRASDEAPALSGDAKNFFVKAELSKSKVYKGEQVIASYYLYRRTRATVRDVMQYPSFQGFIREDLEMPILSNRPDFEAVNLGGIPFERALLARYAIYPIKDGKLRIDGFSVRVDYIPKKPAAEDMMEDPFFQFFTQVTPRTGTSKSDPLTVEVLPLPEEGKSALFTGGVGDFEVSSRLESNSIKAHAPMTLQVTVRGKGNVNLVEFPQVNWPKELKFYQAQGKTRNLGQGVQEKTFEVVVIPLQKGAHQIPPIEFEFFNPDTRSYQRRSTQPIALEAQEGEAGSSLASGTPSQNPAEPAPSGYGSVRSGDQRPENGGVMGEPLWRWVSWLGLLIFFGFVGLVIWDQTKKRSLIQLEVLKRKQSEESRWKALESELKGLRSDGSEVQTCSSILERAKEELYKTLDEAFGISSRAISSRDLAKILTESHGVSAEKCRTLSGFLEFTEMMRYSSGAGLNGSEDLRQKSLEALQEIRKICFELPRIPLEKQS
jgi:hypothetical protein